MAARHALWFRELGTTDEGRRKFAIHLRHVNGQRISWLRSLSSALRRP